MIRRKTLKPNQRRLTVKSTKTRGISIFNTLDSTSDLYIKDRSEKKHAARSRLITAPKQIILRKKQMCNIVAKGENAGKQQYFFSTANPFISFDKESARQAERSKKTDRQLDTQRDRQTESRRMIIL